MQDNGAFFESVLNSLPQHIALMARDGRVIWVNQAWKTFSQDNGGRFDRTCAPANYLDECDRAARDGEDAAAQVASGFRDVIDGRRSEFDFEYPCHSPDRIRWFLMRMRPIGNDDFIVTHENITEQKLAELRLSKEAQTDALTGLANRRKFERFLDAEIRRAQRSGQSISLMMIDVDHFKPFNDTYGHQAGDRCLVAVAKVLATVAKRPSDIAARYGGEEFAILLHQTGRDNALRLAEQVVRLVRGQQLVHEANPPFGVVTVSVGVAVVAPTIDTRNAEVIARADAALYAAKNAGRDRAVLAPDDGAPP